MRAPRGVARQRRTTDDYTARARLRCNARAAAYQAYQRAAPRPDEAEALALLGEVYAAESEWRPSLDAYRASLALADDAAVRETYEELRAKHGFRILDYKVDSDAAAPRVCFQFSERRRGQDRFHALRRGLRRGQRGRHGRGPAALRRRAEARRALRLRAAPGPALGGRRDPAESRPITRSMSATARPRCASPAATTSCRAPARRASRSSR